MTRVFNSLMPRGSSPAPECWNANVPSDGTNVNELTAAPALLATTTSKRPHILVQRTRRWARRGY